MLRSLTSIAVLLATASLLAAPAESRSRAKPRYEPPPLKDCTRLNARYGYYGNPWCTKAEQDRWDRATSRATR